MAEVSIGDQIEAIVRSLEEKGTSRALIEQTSTLCQAHPEAVLALVQAIIGRLPQNHWELINASLFFLPEADWDPLVGFALDALEARSDNRAALNAIDSACDQALPALYPHLERFFWHQARTAQDIDLWPWRDSGTLSLDFLRSVVEGPESSNIRYDAWKAMFETRHPTVINEAIRLHKTTAFFSDTPSLLEDFSNDLYQVGFDATSGELRRLVPDSAYHLIFPKSAFKGLVRPPETRWDDMDWPPPPNRVHPTWSLGPAPHLPPMRFGGFAESGRCQRCDGRLDRYIVLDPIPEGLGVSGLPRLELATCLTCLGPSASTQYSHHDAAGLARSIDVPFKVRRKYLLGPFLELDVSLAITPRRWYFQDWDPSNNGEENLSRFGGEPALTTTAEDWLCQTCGKPMGFLMQLDSFVPAAGGTEWWWARRGMGIVLWCDHCKVSGYRVGAVW